MLTRHLRTPRFVWRLCETTPCVLAQPEVRLEVVPNGGAHFGATRGGSPNAGTTFGHPRGPSLRFRKCPCGKKGRRPEVRPCVSGNGIGPKPEEDPRSLLQVPENPESGKTGRGPEDDLKPYCKNPESGKLQHPERLTRGRPEATLGKQRIPPRSQPQDLPQPSLCN